MFSAGGSHKPDTWLRPFWYATAIYMPDVGGNDPPAPGNARSLGVPGVSQACCYEHASVKGLIVQKYSNTVQCIALHCTVNAKALLDDIQI